jgi:hypothetical protein
MGTRVSIGTARELKALISALRELKNEKVLP